MYRSARVGLVVALAGALALGTVSTALAHGGNHRSCKKWALAGAQLAQEAGGLGGLVSGVAQTGAGAVAGLVAGEHAAACD